MRIRGIASKFGLLFAWVVSGHISHSIAHARTVCESTFLTAQSRGLVFPDSISVFRFLEQLPRTDLVRDWKMKGRSGAFTDETFLALRSLPAEARERARQTTVDKYLESKARQAARPPFALAEPLVKARRRNLELMMWALSEPLTFRLLGELRGRTKISREELAGIVDGYWDAQGLESKYSFAEAISAARTLQNGALSKFLVEDYVEIYGSFANGKATSLSDIDVHVGPRLGELFRASFESPTDYGVISFRKRTAETLNKALDFSKALLQAERDLAEKLGRSSFEPTEFMTIYSEPQPSLYVDGYYNLYNPVTLRIHADRLIVRIFDGFSSHQAIEIEIKD